MTASQKDTEKTSTAPDKSAAILLLKAIGDTTWRMFVPTIGFTLLGLWIGTMLDAQAAGTIAGIILGVALTTVLMWKQFKKL